MIPAALLCLACLQTGPSDPQVLELAAKIERSMIEDQGKWLDEHLDREALADRMLKNAPGSDPYKTAFRSGLKDSVSLGKTVSASLGEEGSYKLLRLRTVDGQRRPLFRAILSGGVNYHEFVLERGGPKGLRPVDLYVYATGELFSATMRRLYIVALPTEKSSTKEKEFIQVMRKIQRMGTLQTEEKSAEVLAVFDSLPAFLKTERTALIHRITAASSVSPEKAQEAMDAFTKTYPNDPAFDILSIDVHLTNRRFDKSLAAIDGLDKSVGGDPYLHVLRGSVLVMAERYAEARAAGIKAVEQEKGLSQAYWLLVTVSLKERKFGDTAKWLTLLEKDLNVQLADLSSLEMYAEFVASPEHATWQANRGK